MAVVFLGRRGGVGGFQRLVAIKRLHPHLARDTEFVDMFIDEAKVAARIHHQNVVPIVDIETSSEGYFLVMEYVEGDTAARLLARSATSGKRIPAGVVVRVLLDCLAGLHAAHELCDDDGKLLEIVHRDVSPQNLLVGVDGIGRITDFGVARAASRLSTTRTGQLKGKLAYMAPEQARGAKMGGVDRRADLFAVGILLWEMTASRRLFKGDGDADTLNRVLYEPIPTLKSALPTVPASLDAICMRALDRDPKNRFATAAVMADELERAARSGGFLATHREVAAYVESVLGTDISEKREALRQWVARSEPRKEVREVSVRIGELDVRTPAPRPSERTRVEGSKPSGRPPAPVDDVINVSSVSSAAIAVSHPAPSNPVTSTPPPDDSHVELAQRSPRRSRTRSNLRSFGLMAVGFAAAATLILVVPGLHTPRDHADLTPRETAAASAPPREQAIVTAIPGVTEAEASAVVAAPSTLASAAASATVAQTADGHGTATKPRRHKPHATATGTSGSAGPTQGAAPADDKPAAPVDAPLPDDMTHNPYR